MKISATSKIYENAKVVQKGRTWEAEINIGENCLIGDYSFVSVKKLIMDDGSQISPHAVLSGGGEVYLSKYSTIGFGVQVITGTDTTTGKYMCEAAPSSERKIIRGSVSLGEGAYIGANAVVCVSKRCPHISIGDFTVIGSLTYIDKSIPSNTVVIPQKNYICKKRFE